MSPPLHPNNTFEFPLLNDVITNMGARLNEQDFQNSNFSVQMGKPNFKINYTTHCRNKIR